ncbi:MAB_1171c family putative transporter [Streptomyces sp. NPDC002054]|uniref:MAB_1171c family putative transporter n=1 Tax=Streptomyces sp. NPDC002054 TaxID=3154663 RepID=UPI0033304C9E
MSPVGWGFYLPCALLLLAAFLKVPALLRNPKDALLRSVCVLLFVGAGVFASAALPSIAAVNRITGTPNAAAPVVYSLLTAFSGANIVLIIRWSNGPGNAEWTTRWARRCTTATIAVIVAINALFLLGDAPVERLRDLDTYYASTPFIREMIVLYLVAHTIAAITMTILCGRWAREVPGTLRAGLVLIVLGYSLNLGFDALKLTAVGARWTGRDLDHLSWQYAPVLASLSAFLIGTGFVLPLVSRGLSNHVRIWRRYYQLQPLWRELRETTRDRLSPAPGPWTPIGMRVIRLEADIHDGILTVNPFLDARQRDRALDEALAASPTEAEAAAAIADAAALVHAVALWAGADEQTELAAHAADDGLVLASPHDADGLVRMSLALSTSDIVRAAREAATLGSTTR